MITWNESRAQELLSKPEVKEVMKIRCEETGQHDWVNCCSAFLQIYQRCKWCGEVK